MSVSSWYQFNTKVLIVPLWNWNTKYRPHRKHRVSSNRTFMELKFRLLDLCGYGIAVLIVPLWNWNSDVRKVFPLDSYGSNRTFMELKLLLMPSTNSIVLRSNRTFMELKFLSMMAFLTLYHVLIVPLWNWNMRWTYKIIVNNGSNRTFMELKFMILSLRRWLTSCSNRTFMELK